MLGLWHLQLHSSLRDHLLAIIVRKLSAKSNKVSRTSESLWSRTLHVHANWQLKHIVGLPVKLPSMHNMTKQYEGPSKVFPFFSPSSHSVKYTLAWRILYFKSLTWFCWIHTQVAQLSIFDKTPFPPQFYTVLEPNTYLSQYINTLQVNYYHKMCWPNNCLAIRQVDKVRRAFN